MKMLKRVIVKVVFKLKEYFLFFVFKFVTYPSQCDYVVLVLSDFASQCFDVRVDRTIISIKVVTPYVREKVTKKYTIDTLVIDDGAREVYVDDEKAILTLKEYELLKYLNVLFIAYR